jgi:hypothetical protein
MHMKPYRQGRLDGLCGVYSVINAARLAIWPTHQLSVGSCGVLFRLMTTKLAGRAKLLDVLTGGSRHVLVSTLLREADGWLAEAYGVRLRYKRPYYRCEPAVSPTAIAATLAQHLAAGHVSAIVGLTGGIEHWTVVRAVRPKTMLLFDSDDLKRLPLDPARLSVELVANELFLIRCEGPTLAVGRAAARRRF